MHKSHKLAIYVFTTLVSFNTVASTVLDQVNDATINDNYWFNITSNHLQQGVTAGLDGVLSNIEVFFYQAGTVDFSINLGSPWQSDANDYQDNALSVVAGWNNIDISLANIMVNAGDEFVIGLQGAGGSTNLVHGNILNEYAAGNVYLNGSISSSSDHDTHFRTYVSAVPVPAAAWLFGSGLIGLIGVARRKKA